MNRILLSILMGIAATCGIAVWCASQGPVAFDGTLVVPADGLTVAGQRGSIPIDGAGCARLVSFGYAETIAFPDHRREVTPQDIANDLAELIRNHKPVLDGAGFSRRRIEVEYRGLMHQLESMQVRSGGHRHYAAGWPFLAFEGFVESATGSIVDTPVTTHWARPAVFGSATGSERMLPLFPTYGALLNVAVWSAVAWCVLWSFEFGTRKLLQMNRARRGVCKACAYPLPQGTAACPECGRSNSLRFVSTSAFF